MAYDAWKLALPDTVGNTPEDPMIDVLLYVAAAVLTLYLLLNLVFYIVVLAYLRRSLRRLKEVLEDKGEGTC